MKKKTVFGAVLLALLVLQAQTVFAKPKPTPKTPQTAIQAAYNNGDLVYLGGQDQWDSVIKLLNEGRHRNINALGSGVYWINNDTARGYGGSVLQMASGAGRIDVVRLLVTKGADKNLRSDSGTTALMTAARAGHTDIVRYLVEQGASVNLRDNDGATAASIAYDRGNVDIYDYLFANGAREFEPRQVAQPATPAPSSPSPTTNVYVQPSAPAQSSPAPAPSTPTLQTGRYAWSNSGTNMTMTFNVGIVTAYINNSPIGVWHGTYRINGSQLVITVSAATGDYASMRGRTFSYNITSDTSFSGSGETWVRTGF